jgi:flagellar hook-basal body complex protein FliE
VNVVAIQPDIAPGPGGVTVAAAPDPGFFGRALDEVEALLNGAEHAEDAYAAGTGSLQQAVYQRAQADVALSVAAAAAQHAAAALQSIFNLQV